MLLQSKPPHPSYEEYIFVLILIIEVTVALEKHPCSRCGPSRKQQQPDDSHFSSFFPSSPHSIIIIAFA